MFGPGTTRLDTVTAALREAGLDPEHRDSPAPGGAVPRPAAWVPMPGEEAFAVVVAADVVLTDGPQAWRGAGPRDASVAGYRVAFHERPFRTRGHPYADPAAIFFTVHAEEIVDTVLDWSQWETTWSVTVPADAARTRTSRLRRLARSRAGSADLPVAVDIDPLMLQFLDAEQAASVLVTVDELFLPGVRWRFPRDLTGGRLASRAQVLLRECAPPSRAGGKGIWLVVEGPEPRAEPGLAVRLRRLDGRAAAHRWDRTPEYWHRGDRTPDELHGITGTTTADLVDQVTDTLLTGDVLDALDACGVRTDRGTRRLLSGLPDSFELRRWTDGWVNEATGVLRNAAPWRWHGAVTARARPQRVASLGGFNPNRRPGLFLEHRDGAALLTFDKSASPLVLPRVGWERDPDRELVRLGLLTPDQVPHPPAGR